MSIKPLSNYISWQFSLVLQKTKSSLTNDRNVMKFWYISFNGCFYVNVIWTYPMRFNEWMCTYRCTRIISLRAWRLSLKGIWRFYINQICFWKHFHTFHYKKTKFWESSQESEHIYLRGVLSTFLLKFIFLIVYKQHFYTLSTKFKNHKTVNLLHMYPLRNVMGVVVVVWYY